MVVEADHAPTPHPDERFRELRDWLDQRPFRGPEPLDWRRVER